MSNRDLSETVPDLGRAAEKSWYVFRHLNAGSSQDPRLSYLTAYRRGYRDCLADTSEFAGLQRAMERLADILEDGRVERQVIDSVTDELTS